MNPMGLPPNWQTVKFGDVATFTKKPKDLRYSEYKVDVERKAREVFVLEFLRQGDISTGRAARLLNISRWDLLELMSEARISPFDDSLTAETLDAEVKSALTDFDKYEC